MPDGLKKKIGPLPLWAWALIAGAVLGGVILFSRRGDSGTASYAEDALDQPIIDPTTGATMAGEGGGSALLGGGSAPTLADELNDITGLIGALQQSGLFQPVSGDTAGLIQLAPDQRYYDPLTGETVDGPISKATNAVTEGKTNSAARPTALDRALTAVQTGRIGPINRKRLQKAGFTDNQIDFHLKSKTPLQTPKGKPAAQKSPTTSAPHSGNNHEAVRAPNHAPTALDRAKTAVTTGNIGPVNRKRLIDAGFTNNQIDFHLKRKTPLGKPGG